ncbi:hypothetical protein CTEN210_11981 [Chaetoceros tenuissimus]|uniref:BTB domain-containing protein n=1 Tax=Chaetoceros tenuissimus TaxID=426638 RepID=A0AAD3H9M4_9STRA|nr:hypothetical protein CTEN210_11981 [Chaetoceros tenuissimus]
METVKINVGGRRFEVSRALLKAHPNNSILFFLNDEEEEDVSSQGYDQDGDAEVSFDRDGDMFQYILQYMKDGKVSLPSTVAVDSFIKEMEHYNLEYDKDNIKSETNEDHAEKGDLDSLKESLESMREEEEEAHLVYHSRALARVLYENFIISLAKNHVDESSENRNSLNDKKFYRFTLIMCGHEEKFQREEIQEDKYVKFIEKHGVVAIKAMMNSILKPRFIEITSVVNISSSMAKKRNPPFGFSEGKEDSMPSQDSSPSTESLSSLVTDKAETATSGISKATTLCGSNNSEVATDSSNAYTGRKIEKASRSTAVSTISSSGTRFSFGSSNPTADVDFAPSVESTTSSKGFKFSFGSSTCTSKPISFNFSSKSKESTTKESDAMNKVREAKQSSLMRSDQKVKQTSRSIKTNSPSLFTAYPPSNFDVRIHNVKNQPELNGVIGTILTWISNKERYAVYVSFLQKAISLRPANVVLQTGTVGCITGLQSKPELNRKLGTIKNWVSDFNKYDVQLSCQQVIRIKVENIIVTNFMDRICTSDEAANITSQQMKKSLYNSFDESRTAMRKDLSISLSAAYPPLSTKAPTRISSFLAAFTPLEAAPTAFTFGSSIPAWYSPNTSYTKRSISKKMTTSRPSAFQTKPANTPFLFGAANTKDPNSKSSNIKKSAKPCTNFGISQSNAASSGSKFRKPFSFDKKSFSQGGFQFQIKKENTNAQNKVERMDIQSEEQQFLKNESEIAKNFQKEGKYDEAEPLFRKCHLLSEGILGQRHPDTLSFMSDLASVLEKQGEYEKAETLFSDCLAGREASLGPVHQDTLSSMINLANIYRLQKKYDKAENLYDLCLPKVKSILAYDHQTLLAMYGRSVVYFEKGEKVKAEAELSDCLSKSEKTLGADHPDTLEFKYILAIIHLKNGEIEKARPLLLRVFAKRTATLGSRHPDTIEIMSRLADLYSRQGKYDIAESILKDCLSMNKETYGLNHRMTLTSIFDLAAFYNSRNEYLKSQALYVEWKLIGLNHPLRFQSMIELLQQYMNANDNQCKKSCKDAVERKLRGFVSAPQTPNGADKLNLALFLYDVKQDEEEAIQLLRECLSIRESFRGSHHLDTINTRHILRCYLNRRRIK